MKLIAAILCLVACTYAGEWTAKTHRQIADIHNECANLYSLSPEQRAKAMNLELDNVEPLRKYLVCAYEKMGIFSADHGYYADRVAKQYKMDMKEEQAKRMADFCIDTFYNTDAEVGQAVYTVHSCIMSLPLGKNVQNAAKRGHAHLHH